MTAILVGLRRITILAIFFFMLIVASIPILFNEIGEKYAFENIMLHSTLEAIGAVAAIFMVLILLQMKREGRIQGRYLILSAGFLSMGLLDALHATIQPGNAFVFLHSASSLVGSFCFALVWFPGINRRPWIAPSLFALGITGAFASGIWGVFFPKTLPVMLYQWNFTRTAVSINLFAGVFFFLSAFYFFLRLRKEEGEENTLFALWMVLFGAAELVFESSQIWHLEWWGWHLMRMFAFILVMYYIIQRFHQMAAELYVISERKKAETRTREQHEFLRNVINSLAHPLYVINTDNYSITLANSAATGEKELTGKITYYELTHNRTTPCEGDEHTCPAKEVKATKKAAVFEHVHVNKKGEQRNVEVYAYPLFDKKGNVTQVIENVLDVTDRKKAEELLRKAHEELEQKVKQRTAALEARTQELERMNKLMIGRELKMKKLKREIAKLKGQEDAS